jgi:phospholipid/cholesterol/gamma-HCH transport system permease protein
MKEETYPSAKALEFRLEGQHLAVAGALTVDAVAALDPARVERDSAGATLIDLAAMDGLDTAGAWLLVDLQARLARDGGAVVIEGASSAQAALIETVRANMPDAARPADRSASALDGLERLGRRVVEAWRTGVELTGFLGQTVASIAVLVIRPRRLRATSLVHHCQEVGLNAVPIVALMAFLIGVVLAFQGAAQLRQFGAEVFVVDLIAISVLRELGILLTAIIVAGRSGSAFTAAIGSMKMREEIDAMRTLGLDPVTILVVPRVLALILMLPVLGFIADTAGLVGGALMSWIELGVSPGVFQARLVSNTDVWHFAVGLIKAPFFALIIGVIGCYEGMKVGGDAESLGRLTSTSVVLSIFMVIVVDALFSIFFAVVGV